MVPYHICALLGFLVVNSPEHVLDCFPVQLTLDEEGILCWQNAGQCVQLGTLSLLRGHLTYVLQHLEHRNLGAIRDFNVVVEISIVA
jgi:hypothetical protein